MTEREEYLGDGLYVSFDGWHYCIRAPREGGDHVVYLEVGRGQTLDGLLDYIKRMSKWMDDRLVEAEKAEARVRDAEEGFPND